MLIGGRSPAEAGAISPSTGERRGKGNHGPPAGNPLPRARRCYVSAACFGGVLSQRVGSHGGHRPLPEEGEAELPVDREPCFGRDLSVGGASGGSRGRLCPSCEARR